MVPWAGHLRGSVDGTSYKGPWAGRLRGIGGRVTYGGPWTGPLRWVRRHAPGRTTPSIRIDPAPVIVTVRPGRGACTILPSPTYIAMWLASSK